MFKYYQKICILFLIIMTINCDIITSSSDIEFDKILTTSGRDFTPYLSPDNRYIAFRTVRNTYNPTVAAVNFELWMMFSNGNFERPLISRKIFKNFVSVNEVLWYPNSHNILVKVSLKDNNEIWKVSLFGYKEKINLFHNSPHDLRLSPNGHKIAYRSSGRLYVANSNGTEPVLIDDGVSLGYAWKYDSQSLIYSLYDNVNNNYDIWCSSVDGIEKTRISETLSSEKDPSYSFDGKYIAYSTNNELYITPSQVFQPKKLLTNARHPKWVPGKYLIYIHSEQTHDSLSSWTESWIVDLNGNITKKIAEGHYTEVDFSQDGEYYIYILDGNIWIARFP